MGLSNLLSEYAMWHVSILLLVGSGLASTLGLLCVSTWNIDGQVCLKCYRHSTHMLVSVWGSFESSGDSLPMRNLWALFHVSIPTSISSCLCQHLAFSVSSFFVLGDGTLAIQPRSGQVLHPRSFIFISSYGLWWIFLINDWRGRAQHSGWWPQLLKESRLSKPNGSKQVSSTITVCCFCSSSCLRKTEPQMGSEYKAQPGKEMRGIPASMESCGGFMCSKGHWKDMEDPVIWWNYKASLVTTRNQQSIFFLRQDFSL